MKRINPSHIPAVSPAALALINQVRAEARAALLVELSAKDGITVLHPLDRETTRCSVDLNGSDLQWIDETGSRVSCVRYYQEPSTWKGRPHMRGYWHPAYWHVSLSRIDTTGLRWGANPDRHVMDDFGALVCVEGIAP